MIKFNLIKTHLFTIVTISTLLSCSKEFEINTIIENIEKQLPICLNEYKLIQAPDSIPYVPLKFSDNKSKVEQKFKQVFGEDLCDKSFYYKLPLAIHNEKHLSVATSFTKLCNVDILMRFRFIEILINNEGEVLFEGKPVNKDSIGVSIFNQYLKIISDTNITDFIEPISIKWNLTTPNDSMNKIMDQIIDGYLLTANYYSHNRYNVHICKLTNEEINKIKEIFPLKLNFANFQFISPPPPPPPPTIEPIIK